MRGPCALLLLAAVLSTFSLPSLAQSPAPAPEPPPIGNLTNDWVLAGLGNTTGPPTDNATANADPPYIIQKANILADAAAAALAVVRGTTSRGSSMLTSYVATSSSNAAQVGQTNAKGLLLYTPTNSTLDGADFNSFFSASYANGSAKGIALTPGIYFINNQMPSFHLNLYCFDRPAGINFELDFTGSTIYFGNYQNGGIGFFFCSNLYFHGPFNFMYTADALPFSQGTITAYTDIGNGLANYTVVTDTGYPTTTTGLGDGRAHLCAVYYPNGTIVTNTTDVYTLPATLVSGTTYNFTGGAAPNIQVGYKLAIRGNAGNHGIFTYKATNMQISNINMFTAPIFGFLDVLSTNTTISSNVIQPWPLPIGSTKPLISTNADGIHSAGGRFIGPSIVGNQVLSPGDDGIAVHGAYYTVYAPDPSTNSLVIFSPNCGSSFCQIFFAGDPIKVYSPPYTTTDGATFTAAPSAFTNLGTATITDIQLLNPQPFGDGSADANNHSGLPFAGDTGSSVYPLVNYNSGFYYRVSLDSFPPGFGSATKDALITDLATNGNNFRITSNVVGNHRARGIHNKASNGVIANNLVQATTAYGLLQTSDLYFLEGDFSQNVTLFNNFFNVPFASVAQYVLNPTDGSLVITQNINNITYTGNVFDNAGTWAAAFSSSSNTAITGNLIRNAGCYPFVYGQIESFIPPTTLMFLAEMSNVTLRGNTFITTKGCDATYGNYAFPYYAQDVMFAT